MMRPSVFRPRPRAVRCGATRFAAALLLLAAAACESLLLTPSQYGELRVVVSTESGDPVAGVQVVLYTGPRPMYYSHTDASGGYTFEQVPPGNYGVAGTMPEGMCDANGSATLVKDDLDMVPGSQRVVIFTIRPCVVAPSAPAPVR